MPDPTITPAIEHGHIGYVVAIVDTGVPVDRIGGGRRLAERLGVRFFAPPGGPARATTLVPGTSIGVVAGVAVEAGGPDTLALVVETHVMVGDLDRDTPVPDRARADLVVAARHRLADRYPDAASHGSGGTRAAEDLRSLPAPPVRARPINAEAVELTNRGLADMYWADPRFVGETSSISWDELRGRLGSPWSPTVIDLRTTGESIEGARRIASSRLASELLGLTAGRDLVVAADDDATAIQAAGFLTRVGLRASWLPGTG